MNSRLRQQLNESVAILVVLPHPDHAPGSDAWEMDLHIRDDVDTAAFARMLRNAADALEAEQSCR